MTKLQNESDRNGSKWSLGCQRRVPIILDLAENIQWYEDKKYLIYGLPKVTRMTKMQNDWDQNG